MADNFVDDSFSITGIVDAQEYIASARSQEPQPLNFKVPTTSGTYVVPLPPEVHQLRLDIDGSAGNQRVGTECLNNPEANGALVFDLKVNPGDSIAGYFESTGTQREFVAAELFSNELLSLSFLQASEHHDLGQLVKPRGFSIDASQGFKHLIDPEFMTPSANEPDWVASPSHSSLYKYGRGIGQLLDKNVTHGFDRGKQQGFEEGKSVGYESGFTAGELAGHAAGVAAGRAAQYAEDATTFGTQLAAQQAAVQPMAQQPVQQYQQPMSSGASQMPVSPQEGFKVPRTAAELHAQAQAAQQANTSVPQPQTAPAPSQQSNNGYTRRSRQTAKSDTKQNNGSKKLSSFDNPVSVAPGDRVSIPITMSPVRNAGGKWAKGANLIAVTIPVSDNQRYFFELRDTYLQSAGVNTSAMGPAVMSVNPNDELVGGVLHGNQYYVSRKEKVSAGKVAEDVTNYQQKMGLAQAGPGDLSDMLAPSNVQTPTATPASSVSQNTPGSN